MSAGRPGMKYLLRNTALSINVSGFSLPESLADELPLRICEILPSTLCTVLIIDCTQASIAFISALNNCAERVLIAALQLPKQKKALPTQRNTSKVRMIAVVFITNPTSVGG